jgi:hypothetical protein
MQDHLKPFACAAIICLVAVGGCSTGQSNAVLVHPVTGRAVHCELLSGDMVKKCVEVAEKRGYVRSENLTPDQRAHLTKQGFVTTGEVNVEQRKEADRTHIPNEHGPSIP